MPTDNPKISAYVPQVIYDCFDEFHRDSGLSMSQSAAVIFAKFFGLEDIAKEITGETTTDNSALDRIKVLESQVSDLFGRLSKLENKPDSELPDSIVAQPEIPGINGGAENNILSELPVSLPIQTTDASNIYIDNLLGEPLGELPKISPIKGKILEKRLILSKTGKSIGESKLSTENKRATDDFSQWTMELDIDNIGWEYKGRKIGYVPASKLSTELQSKLLKWIQENP